MPDYVTREGFEARVGVLEGEVEGEKMVTRYILEQTRRNGDDLAGIKTRLGRVESRLDGLDRRLGAVEGKVGGLDRTVQDLLKNLPKVIGDVMRQVLREREAKS
jgi:hypothetical protein